MILELVDPPGVQRKVPPLGVPLAVSVTEEPGQNDCAVPEIVGVGLTVTTT